MDEKGAVALEAFDLATGNAGAFEVGEEHMVSRSEAVDFERFDSSIGKAVASEWE